MSPSPLAPSSFSKKLGHTLAIACLVAWAGSGRAQVGYQIQGNYQGAPLPAAYQQRGAALPPPPQAGAGLPPASGYGYAQQGFSQPVFPAGSYPANAAYQQLPVKSSQRAKSKAPQQSLLPGQGQPMLPPPPPAYQPGDPIPYPQIAPAPKPAPKPVDGTNDRLLHDIAELQANDRTQDRRLLALEQRSIGTQPLAGNAKPAPVQTAAYTRHQVRPGESLWGIADRYRTSPDDIRAANRLPSNFVTAGEVLLIPIHSAAGKSGSVAGGGSASKPQSGGSHVVQRGESLSGIASLYHVSLSKLQSANNIKNPNLITVGQRLAIPGKTSVASATSAAPKSVSQKKSAAPARYISASADAGSKVVKAPEPSSVPGAVTAIAAAKPKGPRGVTSYRIEPGDTLEGIARSYSTSPAELQRINRLSGNRLPGVGEEIVVPLPGAVSL